MSRHHSSVASEVNHIINDVSRLSDEEKLEIYGIVVNRDGSITDTAYNMKFSSIGEWARFSIQDDGSGNDEEDRHSHYADDDF